MSCWRYTSPGSLYLSICLLALSYPPPCPEHLTQGQGHGNCSIHTCWVSEWILIIYIFTRWEQGSEIRSDLLRVAHLGEHCQAGDSELTVAKTPTSIEKICFEALWEGGKGGKRGMEIISAFQICIKNIKHMLNRNLFKPFQTVLFQHLLSPAVSSSGTFRRALWNNSPLWASPFPSLLTFLHILITVWCPTYLPDCRLLRLQHGAGMSVKSCRVNEKWMSE